MQEFHPHGEVDLRYPDQAGEAFREFIKHFYQNNELIKGEVMIGEKNVDLKNVTMPVLNIFAPTTTWSHPLPRRR